MKKRKKILTIIVGTFVILFVAAIYIYKEYNRRLSDTADLKPDYSLTAAGLIAEFENNEQEANKKFWDKVIEVNGMVKEVSTDESGTNTVMLGDTTSMSSIRCSIDSAHSDESSKLTRGINTTLKGICTGFNADELLGSDVILVRCVAVTGK